MCEGVKYINYYLLAFCCITHARQQELLPSLNTQTYTRLKEKLPKVQLKSQLVIIIFALKTLVKILFKCTVVFTKNTLETKW